MYFIACTMQKKIENERNEEVKLVQQEMEEVRRQTEEKEQIRIIAKEEEVTKNFSTAQEDSGSEQEDESVNHRAIYCSGWMALI